MEKALMAWLAIALASFTPEGWLVAGPAAECGSCVTVPTACSTSGSLCSAGASASGAPVTCTEALCSLSAFPACRGPHHGRPHAASYACCVERRSSREMPPPRSGGLTSKDTTPGSAAAMGPGAGSCRPDPAGQHLYDCCLSTLVCLLNACLYLASLLFFAIIPCKDVERVRGRASSAQHQRPSKLVLHVGIGRGLNGRQPGEWDAHQQVRRPGPVPCLSAQPALQPPGCTRMRTHQAPSTEHGTGKKGLNSRSGSCRCGKGPSALLISTVAAGCARTITLEKHQQPDMPTRALLSTAEARRVLQAWSCTPLPWLPLAWAIEPSLPEAASPSQDLSTMSRILVALLQQ